MKGEEMKLTFKGVVSIFTLANEPGIEI